MGLGLSMMGDLAPGASMLELDPDSTYAEQTKDLSEHEGQQKTFEESLAELTTPVTPTAKTAEKPSWSWGDRIRARKSTR